MATVNKEILQHLDFNDRLLSIARSQVGNQEMPKGSNWGKHVQKYLASVGITFPTPSEKLPHDLQERLHR